MMNFEKYTNSSKKIINSAQNLALGKKHQKIAPIHIINELLNSNNLFYIYNTKHSPYSPHFLPYGQH